MMARVRHDHTASQATHAPGAQPKPSTTDTQPRPAGTETATPGTHPEPPTTDTQRRPAGTETVAAGGEGGSSPQPMRSEARQ